MNNPLDASPSKGNQGTSGKEKLFWPRWELNPRSTVTLSTELRGGTEKVGDDLIYTSELILCSTICGLSAKRHNIHMYPFSFSMTS